MIEIEKGVALPQRDGRGVRMTYPLRKMDVGDSFFIACEPDEQKKTQARVCNAACGVGLRIGAKFTTRQVEGGVRLWRVE
jgi:hypothetical protein